MENRLLVDWFSFSIRIDEHASLEVQLRNVLDANLIYNILGIEASEFSSIGRVRYYKECYKCEGVTVALPYEGEEGRQGYLVTMTGDGCRFFENRLASDDMSLTSTKIWRRLFKKLRDLTAAGYSINIPRMDIAMDDFEGYLDMDEILRCLKDGEVCSRFVNKGVMVGNETVYVMPSLWTQSFKHGIVGTSIAFGSRKSRSFCRFYDKLAEQRQRHYGDEEAMKKIESLRSWIRMELEFKAEVAIAMTNAFIDEADFSKFFSEYVNGMIRFIDRDDSNISRCKIKDWWSKFIGTLNHTSLSLGDYQPVSRERHLSYVYHQLSGVIYTAMNIEGVDKFLSVICDNVKDRLKRKYCDLCDGLEYNLENLCSHDLWMFLRPQSSCAVAME